MEDLDFFGVAKTPSGYIVTKNGERFLACSGGKKEAEAIAETLNKDVRRKTRE